MEKTIKANKHSIYELFVSSIIAIVILACSGAQVKSNNEGFLQSGDTAGRLYAAFLYIEAENSFNDIKEEAIAINNLGICIGERTPLTLEQEMVFTRWKNRIKLLDNKYQKNISKTVVDISTWYSMVNTSELPVERSYITSFFRGFTSGMYEVLYNIKSGKEISSGIS